MSRAIDITSPSNGSRTVVLVGRTGNGKSATANTILGKKKAFLSRASSAGVTTTCELRSTVLGNGQTINVIDTPGLFDMSADPVFISKEITKCINLAKDGIHAFLVVLSARNRFTPEEEAAFRSLQSLFGNKIADYMIVVFTGGDQLEDNGITLDQYLGRDCPKPLKEILSMAKDRRVLFDNKTKDERKRTQQVQVLLDLVNKVVALNGGQPYTNEFFLEVQKEATKLRDRQIQIESTKEYSQRETSDMKKEMQRQYDDKLKQITHELEKKVKSLEKQMVQEEAARRTANQFAQPPERKLMEGVGTVIEAVGELTERVRCAIL